MSDIYPTLVLQEEYIYIEKKHKKSMDKRAIFIILGIVLLVVVSSVAYILIENIFPGESGSIKRVQQKDIPRLDKQVPPPSPDYEALRAHAVNFPREVKDNQATPVQPLPSESAVEIPTPAQS